MKWTFLLILVLLISLTGCQINSEQESTPVVQSSTRLVSTSSVQPATRIEKPNPSSATETSEPFLATETSTPPIVTATTLNVPSEDDANADVLFVKAQLQGDDTWNFVVTVEHPDTGWEDYADGWDVVLPDGTVLKSDPTSPFTRLLLHPHETEQPFTRSQGNLKIPPDIERVFVRAHDLVDGFGGKEIIVDLTVESGQDFEVLR